MTKSPLGRVIFGIGLVFAILLGGAVGYMILRAGPPLDAFYMTAITVSTVGYGETRPLGPGGRIFTIILIYCGWAPFFTSSPN